MDLENPPAKRVKLMFEREDIECFHDNGAVVKPPERDFKANLSQNLQELYPHQNEQEEMAKSRISLMEKPLFLMKEALVETEKLKMMTENFKEYYKADSTFKIVGRAGQSELTLLKNNAGQNVQAILEKGSRDLKKRRKIHQKYTSLLLELQSSAPGNDSWNIKRSTHQQTRPFVDLGFLNSTYPVSLVTDSQVDGIDEDEEEEEELEGETPKRDGWKDYFDFILTPPITFGRRKYRISRFIDKSLNEVLQMSQKSVFSQEVFKEFVETMKNMHSNKIVRYTSMMIEVEITPSKWLRLSLVQENVRFWGLSIEHNVEEHDEGSKEVSRNRKFGEMIILLLKESLIKKWKNYRFDRAFFDGISEEDEGIRKNISISEIMGFIEHYILVSELKKKCYQEDNIELFKVTRFEYPCKSLIEVSTLDDQRKLVVNGTYIHVGKQLFTVPNMELIVNCLFDNEGF